MTTKRCYWHVESQMSRLKSIFNEQRKSVSLGKLVGRGGEGAVFEITGEPDLLAKIYHLDKARERQHKIVAMIASGMQAKVSNAAFPSLRCLKAVARLRALQCDAPVNRSRFINYIPQQVGVMNFLTQTTGSYFEQL